MAKLRPPKVTEKRVPVFTSEELSELQKACQGKTFAGRRDAAIIAVFRATGVRLAELAGIRYAPDDPARNDVDLQSREIRSRQGREGPGRQDQLRGGPHPGPVLAGASPACAGVAVAVVARG